MKKFLTLAAIFALVFTTCEEPTTEDNTPKLPSLTIRNESSYILTDVKFSGISFASSGNDLPVSGQSVKQLKKEDLNKPGYITFIRKDIGIACRTEAITIGDEDYLFTFFNDRQVEEIANINNKNSLAQISFLSEVTVIRGTLPIAKNQNVNLGEGVIDRSKQFDFTLKNTGVGKLLLTAGGTEPIRISGDTANVFSIVQQPSSPEIAPNASLPFKISFTPKEQQEYTATVTVISNVQSGDYFTFIITATGTPPKPVATLLFNNTVINDEDTIDAGEELGNVVITQSGIITVTIRNDGDIPLAIGNISITGTDANVFSIISPPNPSISAGTSSLFRIQCSPVKEGNSTASLSIPTNDDSRSTIFVHLKVTGERGSAILELSQGSTFIGNNSLTPFNFGQVELGINKSLAFTIKNKGNIALELTGTQAVASSNAAFVIQTQPTKTISPNAEVSFFLQYAPTVEAEENASITIYNNSDELVFTLNVKGTGYVRKPQITIRQGNTVIDQNGEYDFGAFLKGKTSEVTFTIGKSGDANLTFVTDTGNRINLAENTEGFFIVTMQPSSSASVAPGSTTTFTIRFSPTVIETNLNAMVQIKTNSRDHDEFSFRVKGTGRGYLIGETGPGGGLVFYAEGNQFKECSEYLAYGTWNNAVTYIGTTYKGGGYSDWYLPEIWELKLVYQNLYLNDLGDFYEEDYYWSSTEIGTTGAMILFFDDGLDYPDYKTRSDVDIIAVRSFSF